MKKLKLNLDSVRERLTKEEMKKINGGYGGGCGDICHSPDECDGKYQDTGEQSFCFHCEGSNEDQVCE